MKDDQKGRLPLVLDPVLRRMLKICARVTLINATAGPAFSFSTLFALQYSRRNCMMKSLVEKPSMKKVTCCSGSRVQLNC